jgi:hypothetical protein
MIRRATAARYDRGRHKAQLLRKIGAALSPQPTTLTVRPPGRGPSIYYHISGHLGPDGSLTPEGMSLPDEDRVMTGELKWAPGAMEGAFGHRGSAGSDAQGRANVVARQLSTAAGRPSKRNLERLYDAVCKDDVLSIVDRVVERVAQLGLDRQVLHQLGRWLATLGVDRGAVKMGIALLGVSGLDEDVDVVRVLGRHDEFTLYAAVAITNGSQNREAELWALGRAVEGWGRIHCVERLAATQHREIREWILREGFRNSIMNEYLAYIAATTGGLDDALRRDEVDRPLLTAAGEILEALVTGGPAQDLDDYADGADAVEAYLALMRVRAESLGDYLAVASIKRFLEQVEGWDVRASRGWSATRREASESWCAAILNAPEWDDHIRVGLMSDDPAEFWRADMAARDRGIDTFDIQVAEIRRDPLGGAWFRAWQQADKDRAELLVSLARQLLPLDEIPTGPSDALGVGPAWRPHAALDWTLQALRDHVGIGPDLVLIGLESPVVRNRNMSLNVLKRWPFESWPERARELAERLAAADPKEKTRAFAAEVLDSSQG